MLQERVVRSSTRFDVADYIRLDDPELKVLITGVDAQGPGASVTEHRAEKTGRQVGKPGDWSIDSILSGM